MISHSFISTWHVIALQRALWKKDVINVSIKIINIKTIIDTQSLQIEGRCCLYSSLSGLDQYQSMIQTLSKEGLGHPLCVQWGEKYPGSKSLAYTNCVFPVCSKVFIYFLAIQHMLSTQTKRLLLQWIKIQDFVSPAFSLLNGRSQCLFKYAPPVVNENGIYPIKCPFVI